MRTTLTALLAIFFIGTTLQAASEPITAQEIIRRADDVRNPSESYYIEVEVVDRGSNEPSHKFHVAIAGNDKTRIETIEPARDNGRNMLMLGENMWVFVPNLKREVRVSLNQKLTGQAANGDISRMRWSGDYQPTIEEETEKEWQLDLQASKKGLTYDRLRVWVEKDSFRPKRAEYMTRTGKVLKKVKYGGYKTLAGRERPSKILIQDATKSNDQSIIKIRKMKVKSFPSSLYQKSELGGNQLR